MRKSAINIASAFLFVLLLCSQQLLADNIAPRITNVVVKTDAQAGKVTITYTLTDPEDKSLAVQLKVSDNNGNTYKLPQGSVEGDVGDNVKPGKRKMVWAYNSQQVNVSNMLFKIVASDRQQVNIAELADKVDSERLKNNVTKIAVVRDAKSDAGKRNLEMIRSAISEHLTANKFQIEHQKFSYGRVPGINIIAKKLGTQYEDSIVVITAPYDGEENSPAANNNGTGVSALMEIAAIIAEHNFKYSIVLVATDFTGEEYIGANYYVFRNGIKDHERIKGAMTLQAIGDYSEKANSHPAGATSKVLFPEIMKEIEADSSRGNFIKVVSNQWSMPVASVFQKNAALVTPSTKVYTENWPEYGEIRVGREDFLQFSDHVCFWYHKYPAITITDARAFISLNDSPNDNASRINYTFMRNVVRSSIAALTELAAIDHSGVYYGKIQ